MIGDRRALIVTTPSVYRLYGEALWTECVRQGTRIETRVYPFAEQSKLMSSVLAICEHARAAGIDRKGVLVALGGGVCSDIVAMAASMLRRGTSHVRIPTTLIGQVDAGIGIKGGVNFGPSKNYLGCFYPPETVLVDPTMLRSLARRHLRQGLAEIVKIALVADPQLFGLVRTWHMHLLESGFQAPADVARQTLERSIRAMLDQLGGNPFENRTFERLVDFGHTVSPIIESDSNYTTSHGEAVSVDMAFSTAVAFLLHDLDRAGYDAIISLLLSIGLPVRSSHLSLDSVRRSFDAAVAHRGGALNLVVPTGIGAARFIKNASVLSESLIADAIGRLNALPESATARDADGADALRAGFGGKAFEHLPYDAQAERRARGPS